VRFQGEDQRFANRCARCLARAAGNLGKSSAALGHACIECAEQANADMHEIGIGPYSTEYREWRIDDTVTCKQQDAACVICCPEWIKEC
jgi:hypothetical protein